MNYDERMERQRVADLVTNARDFIDVAKQMLEKAGLGCYDETYQKLAEARDELGYKVSEVQPTWESERVANMIGSFVKCTYIGEYPTEREM